MSNWIKLHEYQRSKSLFDLVVIVFNIFKDFLSKATGQIEARLHMEPPGPWVGETKVCSRSLGNQIKMATMPIYGKKFSSAEPMSEWPWALVCSIWDMGQL